MNAGRPFDQNECTWLNGTHITGFIRRPDGSIIIGPAKTATMHIWINGGSGSPVWSAERDFPTWGDGRWDADLPRWGTDFEWHIYITEKTRVVPISADLSAVSSGSDKCGQPGTKNYFIADWIQN